MLLNLPSPLFVLRMMVHSIRLPIFLLFFFVTLQGEAQTKHAANALLLLFGSYLPKLQEVSRPLSIGLMAPNEVLVGANIPSAHPSFADVPCWLAFYGRRTDTIVPSQESVRRPDCLLPLGSEQEDDAGKNDGPSLPGCRRREQA